MSESKELACINVLESLLKIEFAQDEYCLGGEKDSAVCIKKDGAKWVVFEKEKNSYNDKCEYYNVVEACFEMLERMFLTNSEEKKSQFLEEIIFVKAAS